MIAFFRFLSILKPSPDPRWLRGQIHAQTVLRGLRGY